MINSDMEFLSLFGWDGYFNSQKAKIDSENFQVAKVICEERNLYRIQLSKELECWASVKGSLQFSAQSRADFPAVGDWVLVEPSGAGERALIHGLLPRKSVIQRKQIGSSVDMQILASNVEYVLIATALTEDLNTRRLERYLTVALESGAQPVILLTKADLYEGERGHLEGELKTHFPMAMAHFLSKTDFSRAEFLSEYLRPGKTCVVVGSSGVGKSTLVNYLIGDEKMKTQETREYDGKGRHTTTSRSLHVTRFGGLIIDTPGMRELQLLDHHEGIQAQFSEVDLLMKNCRFSDCQHLSEPDCAIKAALEEGQLLPSRWQSYQKLADEVSHGLHKQEKWRAAEQKKLWKKVSINARNLRRFKRDEL